MAVFTGGGWAAWRGLFAGFTGINKIWAARREIQKTSTIHWTKIAARLAWNPLLLITRGPVIFTIVGR